MNNIDQLATLRALEQVRISGPIDQFLGNPALAEQMGLKRIQFESHPDLFARLENSCVMLNVTKRVFLEAAMVDAIVRSEQTFLSVYRDAAGEDFKG